MYVHCTSTELDFSHGEPPHEGWRIVLGVLRLFFFVAVGGVLVGCELRAIRSGGASA